MKYNINKAISIFAKQICSHSMHTYFCNGVSENLPIKMYGGMQFRSLNPTSKLYPKHSKHILYVCALVYFDFFSAGATILEKKIWP